MITPLFPLQRIIAADSPLPGVVSAAAGAAMLAVTQAGDNPISSGVLAIIGTFLGATGIGGIAARKFMEDWGRRQEAIRQADQDARTEALRHAKEEREQDRAEHDAWVKRFENVQYWEREQRERERDYLLQQIDVWRTRCDAAEERHTSFVTQYIQRQTNVLSATSPPASPPASPPPRQVEP